MQVPLVSVTAVAPPGNIRNAPAFTVTDAGDPVHLAHVRDAITVSVWAMMPKLFAQCSSDASSSDHGPAAIASVRQMVLNSNPVAIAAAHRGMAVRPDVTAWLPSLNVPTLVVCGEHDAISPPAEMKAIADAIPHARFALIEHAGHMAPMEQPEAVNVAIRQFVGR